MKGKLIYLIALLDILYWDYDRMSEEGKGAYRQLEKVIYAMVNEYE